MLRLEVREDRLDHHVHDLAGGAKRRPPASGLTVDPDTELNLALGQVEDNFAGGRRNTGRKRDAE